MLRRNDKFPPRMELNEMIEKFNREDNCEFEIRTTINFDLYKILIKHFEKESLEISQTLNAISNNDGISNIQTRSFIKGKQISNIIYTSKKQIASKLMRGIREYKIVLARENKLDSEMFSLNSETLYRFKWRHSILLEDWVVDITFSRQTKDSLMIKKIKEEMFRANDEPPEVYDRIELEIERKRRPLHDIDFINTIFEITDRDNFLLMDYNNIVKEMASVLGRNSNYNPTIKDLTSRVVDLTKNKLSQLKPQLGNYYITDKADGERTIIFINKGKLHLLNSKITTIECDDSIAPLIIDSELVENSELYSFDILHFNGESCRENNLTERLNLLKEAVTKINKLSLQWSPTLTNNKQITKKFEVNIKQMFLLGDDIEKQTKLAIKYVEARKYETDGYILTENAGYFNVAYKLKYLSHVSVDFWVIKAPQNIIGIVPYDKPPKGNPILYFLYVGINRMMFEKQNKEFLKSEPIEREKFNDNYLPIHFCPSSDPYAYVFWHKDESLDNKICELTRKYDQWCLMRIRDDRDVNLSTGRYFGNDFRIAENIWQSYSNPVLIDDLYQKDTDYFRVHDNSIYKDVRFFNNKAKTMIIDDATKIIKSRFSGSNITCVDLGGGKGQDLFRYKFDHTIFIDLDKTALQELVSRKNEQDSKKPFVAHGKQHKHHNNRHDHVETKMRVSVIHADLNQNYAITTSAIKRFTNQVHIVICNMAMHYFVENEAAMKNFVNLVSNILIQGGVFVYTDLNGKNVYNLIKNEDWEYKEDTILKYSIRKKFKPNEEFTFGQKINIILPFSNGEHYEECLVNNDKIHDEFKKAKFGSAQEVMFSDIKAELSPEDRKFVNLYSGAIIRKGLPESITSKQIDGGSGKYARHLSSIKKQMTSQQIDE